MDCERRSAVDDDRSRKTRLAVDDDRRQGRWAVDDARSRIAFYQAQSKESLDRVDRNLDLIRENLRAIRKMRMSSATIPRYSSSSSSSISSSASRRRRQPYHDYPPLELPLRWRDPPPRYPPLDRPMRWPDPSSDRAVRNHPRSGFNNSYPFEHHPPPADMNLCTPPASSTPIPPHDSPAFSMLQQNALTGPTADLLHSSMPAAATVEAEDSSVVHVLSAQVSIRSTQSLHHLSPVKSRPISRFRSESPARSLSQAVEFRHNRRRKTQIYNGENIHTTVYMNVDGEEMSKDDEDDSEVDLEMSEDDDEEEGKDFWWSPDPGGTIQLPLPLSPCEPKSSQASIGTALPLPLLPPLPLSLNFLNPMPDSVNFGFCVKQEISANTHPQFSRVINELNERSIMVRFLSGRGSLSSRPVDEEEADVDSEEKLMLKPLHWDQVKESFNQAMVLVKPKSSSFQMIEALFVNNSTAPLPKEQSRRVILPSWKKEDRVLAPKKLQNIATLLRALNDTRKEVSEILLHENTNKLATGFFETLVQMAHKKEVQFKFRNFNGDISKIKLHSIDIVLTNFGVNQDDGYFCNSLIGLHVRCKDIVYARKMIDELHERDVVSWINMIVGYIQNGDVLGSFRLFHEIRTSGIEPNSVALVVVIRAFEVKEIVDGMKTSSRLLREKVSLVLSAKFSCHSHKLARQWLRKPSNEYPGTDLCRKISLLAIVEQGGKEKANLLQHVYEDEMTEEFDPKLWICVSKKL